MAISAVRALEGAAIAVVERGRLSAWGQFRRNRLAVAGLAIVALLLVAALGAPWLAAACHAQGSLVVERGERGGEFLFGADEFGRGILPLLFLWSRARLAVSALSASGCASA